MAKRKSSGICKLTGRVGFYVDSHIIPLSLTRISTGGSKIVEAEIGVPERLRFHGWYDNELVIRAGEDILAAIDSDAILRLRENNLIWDSFPDDYTFPDLTAHNDEPGFRTVELNDAKELRIFFISLLWRVAASTRREFSEIKLDTSTVQDLRERLLKNDPGSICDYPVQLFQIVTKGIRHNRSPILERKPIIDETGKEHGEMEYVRFYLNGLVAHVHIASDYAFPIGYSSTFIGNQPHSIVFAHRFEGSRTYDNIQTLASHQSGL